MYCRDKHIQFRDCTIDWGVIVGLLFALENLFCVQYDTNLLVVYGVMDWGVIIGLLFAMVNFYPVYMDELYPVYRTTQKFW